VISVRSFIAIGAFGLVACGSSDKAPPPPPPPVLPAGWTALASMPEGRGEAAIAALDGKIYLAGGYNTQRTFQIYDIAANAWELGPALSAGTDNAGAVAAAGKVYVLGGEAAQVVQIYDLAARTWTRASPLPEPRFSSAVDVLGGRVHLAGGWSFDRLDNISIATQNVFDLATLSYPSGPFAPMPTARNHAVYGVIAGKLYVAGGRAPGHEAEDGTNVVATEAYDPATNSWTALADLPTPRSGGAGAVLDGKLYVLGGGLPGSTVYKIIERYDPASNTWEKLDDMPVEATGHRAVAVNGSIYVFGGFVVTNGQRQGFVGITNAYRFTPTR